MLFDLLIIEFIDLLLSQSFNDAKIRTFSLSTTAGKLFN